MCGGGGGALSTPADNFGIGRRSETRKPAIETETSHGHFLGSLRFFKDHKSVLGQSTIKMAHFAETAAETGLTIAANPNVYSMLVKG